MSYRLFDICFVAPLPPQYGGKGHSCGGIVHWTRKICIYAENGNDLRIMVVNAIPLWRSIYNFSIWQRDLGMYLSDGINGLIGRDYFAEAFAETLQRATLQSLAVREEIRLTVRKAAEQSFDFRNNTVRK